MQHSTPRSVAAVVGVAAFALLHLSGCFNDESEPACAEDLTCQNACGTPASLPAGTAPEDFCGVFVNADATGTGNGTGTRADPYRSLELGQDELVADEPEAEDPEDGDQDDGQVAFAGGHWSAPPNPPPIP